MDTIIDMPEDLLNKPGTGVLSVPMSVYTAASLLKGLRTIALDELDELDSLTVEIFMSFIAHHVKENAIERLAHLGTKDIDKFLAEDK